MHTAASRCRDNGHAAYCGGNLECVGCRRVDVVDRVGSHSRRQGSRGREPDCGSVRKPVRSPIDDRWRTGRMDAATRRCGRNRRTAHAGCNAERVGCRVYDVVRRACRNADRKRHGCGERQLLPVGQSVCSPYHLRSSRCSVRSRLRSRRGDLCATRCSGYMEVICCRSGNVIRRAYRQSRRQCAGGRKCDSRVIDQAMRGPVDLTWGCDGDRHSIRRWLLKCDGLLR